MVQGPRAALWILLGTLAVSRVRRTLLYQVSPTDPGVFALSSAAVAALALAGYVVPALRASRAEPGSALRAE